VSQGLSRVFSRQSFACAVACALLAAACGSNTEGPDVGTDVATDRAAVPDATSDAGDAGTDAPLPDGGGDAVAVLTLTARVVATGIPGAGAVSQVGVFQPGGPFQTNVMFAPFTQAGRILEADRIFVASSSNFGAPRADATALEGAILSIDPRGTDAIAVPAAFAAADGQVSALDGRLQLYTAQSPEFVNRWNSPLAVTAIFPSVSNPLSISINNGFGRPWFGNAAGTGGPLEATESVTDPSGRPLASAPNATAGGVFAGSLTNRQPQLNTGALVRGVVGTALLGRSSDGSTRAVFAAVNADGSVAQIHVQQGTDGLAPAGTIQALTDLAPRPDNPVTRAGVVFNWTPDPVLYIADPNRNQIVVLTLANDTRIFTVTQTRALASPALDHPVDITPVVDETTNAGFASNTTLAGTSDLYVANRGNGTIVRMRQDGTVVAVRRVEVPGHGALGANQINGVAVSRDAQTIWVTVTGALTGRPGSTGAVVAVPRFPDP
jgi:hypothetical protein